MQNFPLNSFTSVKEIVSKLISGINPKGNIFSVEKEDIQRAKNDGPADHKTFLVSQTQADQLQLTCSF